jgi:glycosyltransferase involved in cell wall biosynthesis
MPTDTAGSPVRALRARVDEAAAAKGATMDATPTVAGDRDRGRLGRRARGGPRVLVFTTLFPSSLQPRHGLFVHHRVAAMAAHCPTRVVAPVLRRPGPWGLGALSAQERRGATAVYRPRYVTPPAVGRFADGLLLYLQSLPVVARLRSHFAFEVVDAHYAFPDGMAAALVSRRFRVPVALTVRGGDLDLLTRFRARRSLIRWTLARADLIFAVSRHMAERAALFGAPRERIRLVENGVDPGEFSHVEQAQARREVGVAAADRLLLCVGHLIPEKGQHVLLEALAQLRSRGSHPVRLVLIGDDPSPRSGYRVRLQRQMEELGIAGRVQLAGGRPQKELQSWYAAADVFVLPTFREGCPNVVREALACGVPVVASRVGGVPELLSSDSLGLLVEPGDATGLAAAIHSALERPWHRELIARTSRRTWADVGAQVATELRVLVSGRKGEGRRGREQALPS